MAGIFSGLTRLISLVYSCTMMCMMLRVQLNIIGGYMYIDNIIKKNGLVSSSALYVNPYYAKLRYIRFLKPM